MPFRKGGVPSLLAREAVPCVSPLSLSLAERGSHDEFLRAPSRERRLPPVELRGIAPSDDFLHVDVRAQLLGTIARVSDGRAKRASTRVMGNANDGIPSCECETDLGVVRVAVADVVVHGRGAGHGLVGSRRDVRARVSE